MIIFGWVCLVALTVWVSLLWLFCSTGAFGLGQPLTGPKRILAWFAFVALAYWWIKVFQWAPFTISAS